VKFSNTFLAQWESQRCCTLGLINARQITISLRAENGDVLQARQVSTQPEKSNAFFQRLTRERLQKSESFAAVLEALLG
jgi:hypothetical protein